MTDRTDRLDQDPEELVFAFLELAGAHDQGDVQAYLANVPERIRGEVARGIERVVHIRKALRTGADPTPSGNAQPQVSREWEIPRIPGFRVEHSLGEGGLGTVWAAQDLALERPVALKVLKAGHRPDQERAILNEARRIAALRHPGIVTVHAVVEGGDRPAIVMERIEGFSIDRIASELGYRERARVLRRVALALAAAHEAGIIHRDLKPANILVGPDLVPRILDFGLALSTAESGRPAEYFEGTPLYASPEQVRGDPLTTASDVFSLGSVAYQVLCGVPPFGGERVHEIFDAILKEDPPYPRTLRRDVPEDLQAICLACLAREPERRPDAGEVARDLGRYLAGAPIQLRPSLYHDILRRRISEEELALEDWARQGMVSGVERDRIHGVFRRILADEDHWIFDARKLSIPQVILHASTWTVVVAMALLVWLGRDDLSPRARWGIPVAASAALFATGAFAQIRREFVVSSSCLAAAVLSLVPSTLAAFGENGWLALRPSGIAQLLDPPFSNHQVLAASLVALGASLAALARVRLTGFAWTCAFLAVAAYISFLLTRDWLDQKPHIQALWCLPLAGLVALGLVCETRGRFRWALPFHLIALASLVVCLDTIAIDGTLLELLGARPAPRRSGGYLTAGRLVPLSLVATAGILAAAQFVLERTRSLDLRNGARILETVVPFHLLGPLYYNARQELGSPHERIDAGLYLGAVLVLLTACVWRARKRYLVAALGGLALGAHLAMELEFVNRTVFALVLGGAGLGSALGTYVYFWTRSRTLRASPAPDEDR